MKTNRTAEKNALGHVVELEDWLGLSASDMALIDMRIDLGETMRARREAKGWSQSELAVAAKTSQSRIAKMERADASATIDAYFRVLSALRVSRPAFGRILTGTTKPVPRRETRGRKAKPRSISVTQ